MGMTYRISNTQVYANQAIRGVHGMVGSSLARVQPNLGRAWDLCFQQWPFTLMVKFKPLELHLTL